MQTDTSIYHRYAAKIQAGTSIGDADLLMNRDGDLTVFYAPFEHINADAKLVLVGITPGMTQAENAINEARRQMKAGATEAEILSRAKATASFSGTGMRSNLTRMLDKIGVNTALGVQSSAELFDQAGHHLHLTSALRFPVFVNGANYNGTPDMLKTRILRHMIETYLAEEAKALPNALWLPLGPKPADALNHLANSGVLSKARILDGMPHPSGANAERVAAFLGKVTAATASRVTNVAKITAARDQLILKVSAIGDRSSSFSR